MSEDEPRRSASRSFRISLFFRSSLICAASCVIGCVLSAVVVWKEGGARYVLFLPCFFSSSVRGLILNVS